MKHSQIPITKLANQLYRCTQAYANRVLEKYQLSSGSYPFLLILNKNEGLNQNQVSRELDVDKAMSARVIKKLIDLEYLRKEADEEDSRAYKLYLTEKAKEIIPAILEELDGWNERITGSLTDTEREQLVNLLDKVLTDAKRHKNILIENEG